MNVIDIIILILLFGSAKMKIPRMGSQITWDQDKSLNYTDFNVEHIFYQDYVVHSKLFKADFPFPVHVVEVHPIGHDGFSYSLSFGEIILALCSAEIPDDMSNAKGHDDDRGMAFTQADAVSGAVPREYLSCFNSYLQIPGGYEDNNLVLPDKYGIKLGTEFTTDIAIMGHLHVHGDKSKFFGKLWRWTLRMYHTNRLRPHDIGVTFFGSHMSTLGVFVPPKKKSFTTSGFCGYKCLEKSAPNGVTVVAITPHSHMTGTYFKIRHFSKDNEKKIVFEQDFTKHKKRTLNFIEPVKYNPGDTMAVECTYDNMGTTPQMLSNDSGHPGEMCLSYSYYYPYNHDFRDNKFQVCFSVHKDSTISKALGNVELEDYWKTYFPHIKSPEQWKGHDLHDYIRNITNFGEDIGNILRYSDQYMMCSNLWPPSNTSVGYPDYIKQQESKQNCDKI